jgi:hypothetical protein
VCRRPTNRRERTRDAADPKPARRTKRKTRLLVICSEHNGRKDVPFMMSTDDGRLRAPGLSANRIVGVGDYNHKTRTFTVGGRSFRVLRDRLLRKLADSDTNGDPR